MCVLKMKFLPSAVQKLSSEQIHSFMKLLPTAYAVGNKDVRNFKYALFIKIISLIVSLLSFQGWFQVFLQYMS